MYVYINLPLTTLLVPSIFETNFSFQAGSIMVMEYWDDTHTKHSLSLGHANKKQVCCHLQKESYPLQTDACPATFTKRVEDLW